MKLVFYDEFYTFYDKSIFAILYSICSHADFGDARRVVMKGDQGNNWKYTRFIAVIYESFFISVFVSLSC